MIVTLKAGYQMFFRLSHILNFAGCTRDQIDDVKCLASYFDHTVIQSICCCHLCLINKILIIMDKYLSNQTLFSLFRYVGGINPLGTQPDFNVVPWFKLGCDVRQPKSNQNPTIVDFMWET